MKVSLAEAICKVQSGEWEFAECIDMDAVLRKFNGSICARRKNEYLTMFEFPADVEDGKMWKEGGKEELPKYIAVQNDTKTIWYVKNTKSCGYEALFCNCSDSEKRAKDYAEMLNAKTE